ncbi:MAG: tetratricopeptide repeat protein [Candidatus Thorarchaeota archaeon]
MEEAPPEFDRYLADEDIPWTEIAVVTAKAKQRGAKNHFEAFTDAVIEIASKETMKPQPNPSIIAMGVEACLMRGRLSEALFISSDVNDIRVMSLRAIVLFVVSDTQGLAELLSTAESLVNENSDTGHRVRLSTIKVLASAAERDTSVIQCVMDFDALLEAHPDQAEIPMPETMFTIYVIGALLRETGEINRALRVADVLQEMSEKQGNRMVRALVENLRGNISNIQGNIKAAREHYMRFKQMSEAMSFDLGVGMALNNMGALALAALSLEEALEYFKQALQYMTMDTGRLTTLVNLGEVAVILGRYDEAEQYLRQAMRLDAKTGKGLVEAYAWYAIMLSRKGMVVEAQRCLRRVEAMAENSERTLSKGIYLLAKGIHEMCSGRIEQSIATLESAVRYAMHESLFEILVPAELELARNHVQAYAKTQHREHLMKAIHRLDDVIQIAKEQSLHGLFAESLVLRSDVLVLAGKGLEAKMELERAADVARLINDSRLETEAVERLKRFAGEEPSEDMVDQGKLSASLERVSAFRTAGAMKEVPMPRLMLLLVLNSNSGLHEYTYRFDPSIDLDSSLVSSFISAITTFSSRLAGDVGLLRSINHEGLALMIEHTQDRMIALVAQHESFELRYRLQQFAKEFDLAYPPRDDIEVVRPGEFSDADRLVERLFLS